MEREDFKAALSVRTNKRNTIDVDKWKVFCLFFVI